jgi:hypothetical protein
MLPAKPRLEPIDSCGHGMDVQRYPVPLVMPDVLLCAQEVVDQVGMAGSDAEDLQWDMDSTFLTVYYSSSFATT